MRLHKKVTIMEQKNCAIKKDRYDTMTQNKHMNIVPKSHEYNCCVKPIFEIKTHMWKYKHGKANSLPPKETREGPFLTQSTIGKANPLPDLKTRLGHPCMRKLTESDATCMRNLSVKSHRYGTQERRCGNVAKQTHESCLHLHKQKHAHENQNALTLKPRNEYRSVRKSSLYVRSMDKKLKATCMRNLSVKTKRYGTQERRWGNVAKQRHEYRASISTNINTLTKIETH